MGLDMYLYANRGIGGWSHSTDAGFDALVNLTGIRPHKGSPYFTVKATIGYWRKANAIHKWFVDNVQGGKDDCGEYYVSRAQLASLRDACQKVLDTAETEDGLLNAGTTWSGGVVEHHTKPGKVVTNPEECAAVLPTKGGFFFGDTAYDEGYLDDLRNTIEIVDRALNDPALQKGWSFEYRSSW